MYKGDYKMRRQTVNRHPSLPLAKRQGEGRLLVDFIFFKNTPFNDFQNTIHFGSNNERDNFFINQNHYETVSVTEPFNFIAQRGHVNIPKNYEECYGINYCTFLQQRNNLRYYAFVIGVNYLNEQTTELILVIDEVMTYTQGNVLNNIGEVDVIREHLDDTSYKYNLERIRLNGDVLQTNTKRYVYNKHTLFKDFWVLFQCSVELSEDFGDEKDPKLPVSGGLTYDRLTSPVGLYLCRTEEFKNFNKLLKNYPWIAQNIKNVFMIPLQFIDTEDIHKIKMKAPNDGFDQLYTFKNNTVTSRQELPDKWTNAELAKLALIDYDKEPHLFRAELTSIELYSWDGQVVILNPAFLVNAGGLTYDVLTSIGYYNQIAIYPKNYRTSPTEQDSEGVNKGQFLNNAIIYKNFNELPVYVDSPALARAQNAHQRELQESRLLTNRVNNITTGDNLQTKFMDAVNLTTEIGGSGVIGGGQKLLSMFTDEYEFYRNQRAQFADQAIIPPTINGQNNGTAFQISTNTYGITLKISSVSPQELTIHRKYYNTFGFEVLERRGLSPVNSMSIMNYVQFKGNWHIDGVPVELMESMKVRFENGMKLWKNNNTANPFRQSIINNTRSF
jgi:hypothetical protein